MATKPKNAQEAEAMEAAAAEFRAEEAEKANQGKRKKVRPLRKLVNSNAFKKVQADVAALVPDFAAEESIDVHLRPLARFMRNLGEAAVNFVPGEDPEDDAEPPKT